LRPEKETPENTTYNYHVSKVRIRSEHCVGFLKGRWSSLKDLRLRIDNEKDLRYATLWITTCIHLHAFAMDHEDGKLISTDAFFLEGQRIIAKDRADNRNILAAREEAAAQEEEELDDENDIELLEGKLKREMLKKELFLYLNGDDEMMLE
jgi:DDE superfamily endonuclease